MAKRRTDWGSMVAGLLFLGLAVAFVVWGSDAWHFDIVWLLPVLAAGLGLTGVARSMYRSRPSEKPTPPTEGD